ncbi:MAG: hypothetical protein ACQETE_02325 [Bacteroidota bacterium]
MNRRWHEIVQPNKRDYTKFVIISRKRSGSTYVQTALQRHPRVQSFGELFMGEDHIDWKHPGYQIECWNQRARHIRNEDVNSFMHRYVYRSYPRGIKAVGFKLFFIQGGISSGPVSIWNYLVSDPSIHIIRLVRSNYLAVLTSKQEAIESKVWFKTKPSKTSTVKPQNPIWLNPEECEHLFSSFDIEDRMLKERFENHPYRYVTFENILHDSQQLADLQSFLDIEVRDLKPKTYKQARRTLRDRIANFEQLKDHFKGSKWARFFDE